MHTRVKDKNNEIIKSIYKILPMKYFREKHKFYNKYIKKYSTIFQ